MMRCPRQDCYGLNMKYSLMIHVLKAQVPALAIFLLLWSNGMPKRYFWNKELILAYGSRVRVYNGRGGMEAGGRDRKLRSHQW